MGDRRSIWPAALSGLAGLGLLIAGLALPWVSGRTGSQLPWRAMLPWDLAAAQTQSVLTSIALPIVVSAFLCLIAIIVRVRRLAIALACVTLGFEIAWFASEFFRRASSDRMISQLELGAWLALGGAALVMVGAFLTPRWEPQVR